ncbi:ATP-binding protein [Dasania marina]|uniref:hybrid sensor histidine kinase/response regulator n=1 Tax=Dasania marina TaxID=471499 RepID=UPI0030D92835
MILISFIVLVVFAGYSSHQFYKTAQALDKQGFNSPPELALQIKSTIIFGSIFIIVCTLLILFLIYNHIKIKRRLILRDSEEGHIGDLLKKSERHLQAILDGSHDGIISIDNHGVIESFSLGASKTFGYDSCEVIGKDISVIILDEEKNQHKTYLKKASLTGIKYLHRSRQLYGRHKSGAPIPLEVTLNSYEENNKKKYVGVVRDISHLAVERNNLVTALQDAELASEAKNRLLSSASHELRTPLNAILGFSEILSKDNKIISDDDHFSYVQDIYSSAKLLLQLVNDVLDYAKIDSKKMKLIIDKVEVREVLQECLRMHSAAISEHKLKLKLCCKDSLWAYADRVRLKQVIINIISNAIKFNKERGLVTVDVSIENKQYVIISIADTGMGISENRITDLFEPFSRLHDLNIHIDGSGIGLSLSKNLIEKMNGEISYQNNPLGGSIFYIKIPLAKNPIIEIPIKQSLRKIEWGHLDVLYIEDNNVNIRLMERMLSRIGVNVNAVQSAELAYQYLESHKPNIILMDINLPGDCGHTAAKKILAMSDFTHTPILAVSASIDEMNDARDIFFDVIGKPFKSEELYLALQKASDSAIQKQNA